MSDIRDQRIEVIKEGFKERGIHYVLDQETYTFHVMFPVKGPFGQVTILLHVSEQPLLHIMTTIPARPDVDSPETMMETALFIHRVNFDIPYGAFLFDVNDGEIRFSCPVSLAGTNLTWEMVEFVLTHLFTTIRIYTESILAVVLYRATAKEASEAAMQRQRKLINEAANRED